MKLQNDPIKLAEHRLKEKERLQRTRKAEKEATIKDPRRKVWQTMQENMRKADYRRRLKEQRQKEKKQKEKEAEEKAAEGKEAEG